MYAFKLQEARRPVHDLKHRRAVVVCARASFGAVIMRNNGLYLKHGVVARSRILHINVAGVSFGNHRRRNACRAEPLLNKPAAVAAGVNKRMKISGKKIHIFSIGRSAAKRKRS